MTVRAKTDALFDLAGGDVDFRERGVGAGADHRLVRLEEGGVLEPRLDPLRQVERRHDDPLDHLAGARLDGPKIRDLAFATAARSARPNLAGLDYGWIRRPPVDTRHSEIEPQSRLRLVANLRHSTTLFSQCQGK